MDMTSLMPLLLGVGLVVLLVVGLLACSRPSTSRSRKAPR